MPDLLVGANLAVLVAASRLADAGRDVVLLTDGQKLGGHFRGVSIEGHDFDIGRVMVERAEPRMMGTLAERPDDDLNWTHWAGVVDEVFAEHLTLRRTSTPQSYVGGQRWPDHIISNRLDVMAKGFSPPEPLSRDDERHASRKAVSAAFETLTYAEAARLNHGDDVHRELFEPFVRKLLGVGSDGFLARYHRSAWTPLYWPETVAGACAGAPTTLPEYPLWASTTGCTGELVRQLVAKVQASPHVVVDEAPVSHLRLTSDGAAVSTGATDAWRGPRLALGTAGPRAAELAGVPAPSPRPAAPVVVAFGLARSAAITQETSCLYVVDNDYDTYRITDQESLAGSDPEWHRVVVESTGGGPTAGDTAAATELLGREARAHLGVDDPDDLRLLRVMRADGAKPIPTASAVAAVRDLAHALREALPNVELTGALLSWEAPALNEQVVQGHRIAERWTP